MKIFISWSGDRSKALAQALRDWLPLVLHYVKPWLSDTDVAAGSRWAQEVAQELEASNIGIICVTPENLGSSWVLFEAGALAKSMQVAKVIPLIFDLDFSDIAGPLAQFQAKKAERDGIGEIIYSINQASENPIDQGQTERLFSALWPEFENQIISISTEAPKEKQARSQKEILEELVTGIRGLDSRLQVIERSFTQSLSVTRRRSPSIVFASAQDRDGELFMRPVNYDSLAWYTLWRFPGLEVSPHWQKALLNDIDHNRYQTISDIDRVVNSAHEAVTKYSKEKPELFQCGTDYITKSLIFSDKDFRAQHTVSRTTLDAVSRYQSLLQEEN